MPSTKSGKEWSKIIYEEIEKNVAVNFIVFNEKEFQEEKEINPFIKDIIENGKLIYSKNLKLVYRGSGTLYTIFKI